MTIAMHMMEELHTILFHLQYCFGALIKLIRELILGPIAIVIRCHWDTVHLDLKRLILPP